MIPAFLNPKSGGAPEVRRVLERAGCFALREVAPDGMTQAVRAAITSGERRVAVVGGDGTVSAAAAAIAHTPVELAIIPAGTFNHFARDHGIPMDLGHACELARSGTVQPADVGWVNGRLFLNTSSVGIYANFVRVRERLERRTGYWGASALAVARTFVHVRPFRVWFEAEGVERAYDTPLVFIGVGERELKLPALGNRVPDGRPGLHAMVVRGRTRARLVALSFAAAARGTHTVSRTPHLDSFLVGRCRIEQRHSTVAVDGEIVRLDSPLDYALGRDALRLVRPSR